MSSSLSRKYETSRQETDAEAFFREHQENQELKDSYDPAFGVQQVQEGPRTRLGATLTAMELLAELPWR